ncbi:MAG: TonB-dependent receptor [Verrucomicrobiota bacterium]
MKNKLPLALILSVIWTVATSFVSAQDGQTASSDKVSAEATSEEEDVTVALDQVVITGTDQKRYIIDTTDAATGLELSFLENPRIVTVLPEQLILDRKITTIEEALRNVPGISAGDGFGGAQDDFFLRGFRRNAIYRNGFRRQTAFKTNLSNIEYTQIVSGPAAITYGQVEPGGIVDVVTKKPLDYQRFAGEFRYGSYEDFFTLLDYSTPVSESAAIRIVGSIQDAESFRDFTDINRDTIAITGRIDLTDRTKLIIGHEYREESRPVDRGTVALNTIDGPQIINEVLSIPDSRRFGDPFELYEVTFNFTEATLRHEFNEEWSLEFGTAYEDGISDNFQSRPNAVLVARATDPVTDSGIFTAPPTPLLQATLLSQPYLDETDRVFIAKSADGSQNLENDAYFFNFKLNGEFETGPFTHRAVVGADYLNFELKRQFVRGPMLFGTPGQPLFNVLDPVYQEDSGLVADGVPVDVVDGEDFGFYGNIYSEWNERIGLLLGIRYSETESLSEIEGLDDISISSDGWVPQAGVNFRLLENVSLFASYSESFEPNRELVDGDDLRAFDPEIGEQIEAGIKAEFFDGQLRTSLTVYDIEKTNVLSTNNGITELIDGQTSEGFEFSVAGQPIPGMNVIVAYSYIDAEQNDGITPSGVADQQFNIYASYEWQSGALEGLGIGGGVYYEGDRRVGSNAAGDVISEAYTLVDASIWYTIDAPEFISNAGTIRFQVAAKNLFDETYYGGAGGTLRIPLGTPRTIFGSVSFDF